MGDERQRKPKEDSAQLGDLALARQIVDGSRWALTVLFQRYAAVVRQVALRLLRSVADADDVVQDVFVGLSRSLRTFQGRGSLEGWLRKVTLNTCLMRLRKNRQLGEVALGMDGGVLFKSTSVDPALKLSLDDAIKLLPDSLRIVFVLKEIEGYSHAEIAELLGIEVKTSRVRLYRARQKLRVVLVTL